MQHRAIGLHCLFRKTIVLVICLCLTFVCCSSEVPVSVTPVVVCLVSVKGREHICVSEDV